MESHDNTFGPISLEEPIVKPVAKMAAEVFGGAVIVKKGIVDIITDGKQAYFVSTQGSLKRPGGIGDLLAGTIGTFIQFQQPYRTPQTGEDSVAAQNPMLSACVVASLVVR